MGPIALQLSVDCCTTNVLSIAVQRPRSNAAGIRAKSTRSSSGDSKAHSKGNKIGESTTGSTLVRPEPPDPPNADHRLQTLKESHRLLFTVTSSCHIAWVLTKLCEQVQRQCCLCVTLQHSLHCIPTKEDLPAKRSHLLTSRSST